MAGETAQAALEARGKMLRGYRPQQVEVVAYVDAKHRSQWEAALVEAAAGSLFQSRRFLDYHPAGRFEDASLLFFREGQLVALAAGALSGQDWSAHRFSSHGGIIPLRDVDAGCALDLVFALRAHAADQGWRSLSMRYAPDVLLPPGIETVRWALEIFDFRAQGQELGWCMAGPDPRWHGMQRRGLKKAVAAGLEVGVVEDYAAFWELLAANLAGRFEVKPTHSLEEIEALRRLCPGEVELVAVRDPAEGQMLAGSVVFRLRPGAHHCFYFAQDYARSAQRPMALLMSGLQARYLREDSDLLNLGVITAAGATELNVGLSDFKQRFGAQPTLRRSYRWEAPA